MSTTTVASATTASAGATATAQEQLDPVAVAQKLLGREMTSEEIALNFRIKDTLGLSDTDAIWTLLSVLGVYLAMYKEMPDKIAGKTEELLAGFKVAVAHVTDAAERQAMNRTEKSVIEAFERLLKDTEKKASSMGAINQRKKLTLWSAGIAVGAFVVAASLLWGGVALGERTQQAELAWLNTKEGQAAKRFAKLNNVERMMECPSPQYVVERKDGDYCSHYDTSQKTVRMWRIK